MLIDPVQFAVLPSNGQTPDRRSPTRPASTPAPASPPAPVQAERKPASSTSAKTAIHNEKEQAEAIQRKVRETEVSVTWNEDRIMIFKVTDKLTGDLLSQIPTDQVLGVVHRIDEIIQQMSSARTQREQADKAAQNEAGK